MSRCIGCGIELQNEDPSRLGYVSNLDNKLCVRCFKLKNYGEYTKVNLGNSDYLKIINNIPDDSSVLYVSDILSMDLDSINRFKKVILVITKRDIMPKSIIDGKIIDFVKKRYSNIEDVVIVSSNKNYNMDILYNIINKKHSDIYFVGNTNSGKSTLINKLISDYDNSGDNVTVSMYPSTTLDKVIIKVNDINLIDTPGLIDNGNIMNYLDDKDLKLVCAKKEIRPKSCQIKGKGSILIGNYARINYDTKGNNSFVIYVSNMVPVKFISLSNDKLKNCSNYRFDLGKNKDIVIPGLGFVRCKNNLVVDINVIDGVKPYVRDNLF